MYFLLLSLFFSSLLLALTHAALQDCTSPHTLGLHFFFPLCPNGRMASLFNSSSFPSFLPFTLFTSSHNKCKPITLTLLQPKSPFLQLLRPNDLALYFFLFFLPSACPTCLSQPTHADFVHNEEKLRNMKTCSLNELLTRHVGWTMVQCTQQIVLSK